MFETVKQKGVEIQFDSFKIVWCDINIRAWPQKDVFYLSYGDLWSYIFKGSTMGIPVAKFFLAIPYRWQMTRNRACQVIWSWKGGGPPKPFETPKTYSYWHLQKLCPSTWSLKVQSTESILCIHQFLFNHASFLMKINELAKHPTEVTPKLFVFRFDSRSRLENHVRTT